MTFLVVLVVTTFVAAAVRPRAGSRVWARLGMGAALVIAGASHLARPSPFEQHLPAWLPGATAIVAVTGLLEIAFGLAFVTWPDRRRAVGALIAGYLVAVWPANIYVAIADVDVDGVPGGVHAWLRIPMQLLFIGWAWWSAIPVPRRSDELADHELAVTRR